MKPAKTIASQKIGHLEAKALVCDLFTSIQSSKSVGELTSIPSKLKYGQQITTNMPGAKFPRLRFRVSIEEIEFIRQLGVFADRAQFSPILATGEYAHGKKMTPLEKILYAILWKNGDLGKEQHLISGILGKVHGQKTGTVFHAFGGYIAGQHPYIMDQHTLRCFAVQASSDQEIERVRSLDLIDGTDPEHGAWMEAYRHFYDSVSADLLCEKSDFLYEVDRLLFGAGKFIKRKRNAKWQMSD
jgi:hypothetical protein